MATAATNADADPLASRAATGSHLPFLCPSLCPMHYAPITALLTEQQRRRLNQLTAMSFNELIATFEGTLLGAVEAAGATVRAPALRDALRSFVSEERRHIAAWRTLNRSSDPQRYARTDNAIVPIPRWCGAMIGWIARRRLVLPVTFWIALALEEHSLELSRRCLRAAPGSIDERYRHAYAEHFEDEARHVRLDLRLLTLLYDPLPAWRKRIVARIVITVLSRWMVRPGRSARLVVDAFLREEPSLGSLRPRMLRELRQVGGDPAYLAMMYSREATPILFRRFDRDPIMRSAAQRIPTYRPAPDLPTYPVAGGVRDRVNDEAVLSAPLAPERADA